MPLKTLVVGEEKSMFRFKGQDDSLLLANIVRDFKLKPMLKYHPKNPRILRVATLKSSLCSFTRTIKLR